MQTFITILFFAVFSSPSLLANEALEIVQNIEWASRGKIGIKSKTKMILISSSGRKVERLMTNQMIERPESEDRSLITFIVPKDIKGTKMLTWKRKGLKDNDQWLYLPSLRRVKRIQSRQRYSSFMGSEFSYEDMGAGVSIEKFDYKLLSKVPNKTWVIESRPKTHSGYSKKITTYSVKFMAPLKAEYYDRKKELLKIATFSNWKSYAVNGKTFWRANRVEMKNMQTRKESHLIKMDVQFGIKINNVEFQKNYLKR